MLHILNGLAVGLAPVGAVHEQHVGTLRLGDGHALEMLLDVIAGKVDVAGQHLAELVGPLVALGLVSTDQGVHGEDVHHVVVAQAGLFFHAVTPPAVVNDMVAAHQTGQIEGLGGGIESGGALAGILAHRLGGDVLVSAQDDVRPDLIGDHIHIVLLVQLHGLFQLPALPHTAAGVVGVAHDGGMDLFLFQVLFHVLKVHPPHAVFILDQRAVDSLVAVVLQAHGKTDVGGAVDQDLVALGADAVQGADHAAQHAVLVADALLGQALHAVALCLPPDDGIEVFIGGVEVAKRGVVGALDDGFLDGGHGGEVHIGHPHGDGIKALLGGGGGKAGAKAIHCNGILAVAVHDGSEIVFHSGAPSLKIFIWPHFNTLCRRVQAASTFPRISCGKITNFYGNCTQKAGRHTPTGFY